MKKKTKLGRPKAKSLPVPSWAIKRIEELARSSGVSPERTLESALKMGLYAVAEQYGGLIEFQASADKLFFGEPDNEPLPTARDPETTVESGNPPDNLPSEPEPDINGEVAGLEQPEFEETAENGSFASALQ